MKIGIDISMLVYRGSGVATYTYDLVRALLLEKDPNEYHLFYSSFRRPKEFKYLTEFSNLGAIVHNYYFPPRVLKILWNTYHLIPVEWLIGKVDYYFSSDFLRPPLLPGTIGITTIHDLTWKIFPHFHTAEIVSAHENKIKKTLKYNDIILTDSNNTKKDILHFYPKINNKIYVLPLGIDLDKFCTNKNRKKAPKNPYILYVGAIEPRKNLLVIVDAFSQLIKYRAFSDYRLILAGRAGWKNESVYKRVLDLGLQNKVAFPGYIKDEDLPKLYRDSSLLIYISQYEGFGLPPIEAMACGTRVLTSDNSSLVETIPKQYRMKQINDPRQVMNNIKRVLLLPPPQHTLVRKYNWKNYVYNLKKILNKKTEPK